MKRAATILVLTAIIILTTGCGGGGGGAVLPFIRDLSGLEGTWTNSLMMTGNLSDESGGTVQVDLVSFPVFTITTNSIVYDGEAVDWNYDGNRITITGEYENYYWDPTLGNCIEYGVGTFYIVITPGSTSGIFTASTTVEIETDNAGILTGNLTYTGTMDKV